MTHFNATSMRKDLRNPKSFRVNPDCFRNNFAFLFFPRVLKRVDQTGPVCFFYRAFLRGFRWVRKPEKKVQGFTHRAISSVDFENDLQEARFRRHRRPHRRQHRHAVADGLKIPWVCDPPNWGIEIAQGSKFLLTVSKFALNSNLPLLWC